MFLGFWLFSLSGMMAQEKDGVKTMRPGQLKTFGKSSFNQGDYSSAAMYYQSYVDAKPKNAKITYQLAESYRLSKDYRNAEVMYLKAYELNPKKNALALYHHATMLKMNGKFDQAEEYYKKFKKEYKGKDKSTYLKMIGNNTKAADFVSNSLKNPVKINIEHLDSTINTNHVEAAPVFINDSTIIYSSLKTDQEYYYLNPDDSTSNEPFRKLYSAAKSEDVWQSGGEYPGPFNKEDMHVSNGTFSHDGTRFYFTRCKRNKKNKTICAIYVSTNEDGEWSEPISLGPLVNDNDVTNTQPTIGTESAKNREIIYFVSDREGGKGGLDIWYTTYDSKKKEYKAPSNAGAKLNTPGDEVTPYYDWDTKVLYFSSDGWTGLGGQDIFKTIGELKKWVTPENMGSPLNSSYDDLYYTLNKTNKETGMFVSNRELKGALGAKEHCCDDIFTFQWLDAVKLEVKGMLYESSDSLISSEKIPVKGAKVNIEMKSADDTSYIAVNGVFTDAKGNYSLAVMPNREYRITTKKEGYLATVKEFDTNGKTKSGIVTVDLGMKEAPLGAIGLQNIYYEYGKSTLTQSAKTSIDTTLLVIMTENPDLVIELSSHTDNIGSDTDNQNLSQARAESVVNYLVSKGINPKMLNAKGYGETKPIASNQLADGADNPKGRQLNRRTEFRIIGKMMPDGTIQEQGDF